MASKLTITNGDTRGEKLYGEPERYFINGVEVTEEEFLAVFPDHEGAPGGHSTGAWPMRSEALACHPSQVAAHNERNAKAGIATRYEKDGTAVIPSRSDRAKLLRKEGFHDKSGGYGD